jgi:hypothetical protein
LAEVTKNYLENFDVFVNYGQNLVMLTVRRTKLMLKRYHTNSANIRELVTSKLTLPDAVADAEAHEPTVSWLSNDDEQQLYHQPPQFGSVAHTHEMQ